nr:hypothetical protein 5 [bacterium]
MATRIENIKQGMNKTFAVRASVTNAITQATSYPDITGDTVRLFLKATKDDDDDDAKLNVTADVSSYGATGYALFEISKAQTASVDPGEYWLEVVWDRASGQRHPLLEQQVGVNKTVSDVPS